MDAPKVSIIIPVYNVKPYLEEALDSVINQTYKNLEIIVVDDGSDDGSEKICDEYTIKDNRIVLIRQKNAGLSAARNTGLDNMNGDFVGFLDADDVYHPEMIQKMLESMLFDNADCIVCKHVTFDETKKISFNKYKNNRNKKIYTTSEALKAIANGEIHATAWDKLYKKNLFENIRYPIGQNYEDISTVLKIFEKTKKVLIINDKLVWYRKHTKSITSTNSFKNVQDLCKAYDCIELYIKEHIPEIFTEKELTRFHQENIIFLISKYANIINQKIADKETIQNLLKEKIKEQNLNNEMKNANLETRLIYYLLFNAPSIFSFGARFYPAIRRYIKIHFIELIK
ncbi:glycosyltransferase family 2 protein [bacterium]|nr:glycosyltransferase family 2 protein [bacterium]